MKNKKIQLNMSWIFSYNNRDKCFIDIIKLIMILLIISIIIKGDKMEIKQAIVENAKILKENNIHDSYNIARILMAHTINKSKEYLVINDKEILKERIKNFRKENKYTQNEIGKLLNIDHSVWCRYELGVTTIPTIFLYTICKKFNISADYLLGRIDIEPQINTKEN